MGGDSADKCRLLTKLLNDRDAKVEKRDLEQFGNNFKTLSAKDLAARFEQAETGKGSRVYVFDVREKKAFELSHIPSAISIPPEDINLMPIMQPFSRRLAVFECITDPEALKVICDHGKEESTESATKAARQIRRFGHMHSREILLLEGGLNAWKKSVCSCNGSQWEVVGGEDQGGILVRIGQALSSAKAMSRLATGSRVREVVLIGERLLYELISGEGPDSGWVSTRLNHKELLIPI